MSDYIATGETKVKSVFKLMDDYVVIHSAGDLETKKINLNPNLGLGSYKEHREWNDKHNEVFELASNLKDKLEEGDVVLLSPHAKLQKIEQITEIMEKVLDKKLTVQILNDKGKPTGHNEELEKYFIVNISDILCVVK